MFSADKEELETLQKYLEELSTFLPLPFCIVSPIGAIININKAFADFTGLNETEVIGEETKQIFLDKKEAEILEKKVLAGETIKNQEVILLTKDKNQIIVSLSATSRKDSDNNIIGYFLAFSDITELKKLQRQLEKKVEERTKELQTKIRELEKFYQLAVGRELKMVELKKEIKKKETQEVKK